MTVARSVRDLLDEHPFFGDLAPDDLALIAGCGKIVHFDPGVAVCTEGGDADQFFVVRHGRIVLSVRAPAGGDLAIATIGDGEVLGWSWLFPPYRWHFDARTTTEVRAIALDGACLRAKCDEDPALGYRLMQRFAQLMQVRLQETRLQLLDLYGERRSGQTGG